MNELLELPLETDEDCVAVGKRIHRLALDIGFSDAAAIRAGLSTCEIATRLSADARRARIHVGFQPSETGFYLAIFLPGELKPSERELANVMFDRVVDLTSAESISGSMILQEVPDKGFMPTESFMERQRARSSELSRSELLSELSDRNAELRSLLVELRTRAEDDRRREQAASAREYRKNLELSSAYAELNELREKDRQLANFDILTGLPSRVLFNDRLAQALAHAGRDKTRVALCFMDLDRFKAVNDNGGHSAGDRVLAMVADRLSEGRRSSDTIARIGGDEFTLILPDISDIEAAKNIARSIIDSIAQPFMVEGSCYGIGISIGVAFFPDDAVEIEALIRCADTALYSVKAAGRNDVRCYAEISD
ncbi:GGDEF domain-containing protein [Pseudohongiella sp.]|uniref:GGDEF domain-containing protein n=1 Tax=marine sediment metagenome TaxID=412755 RepID=A0A0F9Y4K3_9ZZZZ|nr:GGDEF domain-containing protein [Pseudohongiella sp.]HDZ09988.1 diguanylate cyclase [Pseudohongiella sp.]